MAEIFSPRRRRSGALRYVPVTVLLFAAALIIGLCGLFRVTDIEITGANVYSEEKVADASGIERGDELMFFSPAKAEKSLVDSLAYASRATVSVKYPSTVNIQLEESFAIASIFSGSSYWLIDADGKILEETNLAGTEGTITVTGISLLGPEEGKTAVGDNETRTVYLIELLRAMRSRNFHTKVTELTINSIANISFDYDGRFTVNFGDGSSSGAKLDKLLDVMSRLEPDAAGTLEIAADGSIHYIPV